MKVSLTQRIYFFIFTCCILFIVIVGSILWSSQKVELAFSRENYTQEVANYANILKQLIITDNIYASDYDGSNWLKLQSKLMNLLQSAPALTPQQQIIQNSINSQSQSAKQLFNKINENKLKDANESIKKHLKTRLMTQLEVIRADSVQLSNIVQKDIYNVIKQQALFIFIILAVSILILLYGSARLTRVFKISLNEVKSAFENNHSGNFQKIELSNHSDEFASIVTAFNLMNYKLSETMVSLAMMKNIVEDRTRVLEQLSNTDPLTKVANRRALFERGDLELSRADRIHNNLSLILIDCDYFKNVNDEYGHQVGDEVLKHICKICNQEIRSIDFLGRYGGEEFIIILPNCNIDGGIEIAKRIQNSLMDNCLIFEGEPLKVTLSMGISMLTDESETFEQLINKADKAMYVAKENGRNRIEVSLKNLT
ncbi:diguanylate cyclase [Pseudocolwellia sp. AS88]|uniref:diguanylate cyclase n=1 Tax=Pseudocolwellia sp. AS88 TaxID=3063958 RepID=UPI0026F23F23|nr:diguanylate cyclase [Pseudocolwellia sp. AS88]MDO7083401.1 diguanylate cyclase [Pseudocolwellia sp. AS88]